MSPMSRMYVSMHPPSSIAGRIPRRTLFLTARRPHALEHRLQHVLIRDGRVEVFPCDEGVLMQPIQDELHRQREMLRGGLQIAFRDAPQAGDMLQRAGI